MGRWYRVAAVLGVMVASVLFVGAARKQKGGARLIVSPSVGLRPLRVTATALVKDPRHELRCPGYAWSWGDGSVETEWSDCDPYQLESEMPDSYAPGSKTHVYRETGRYTITFAAGNRTTSHRDVAYVDVRGGQ